MPANDPPTKRIAIIGAGITGLAAAHRLIELGNSKIEVFEAGVTPGGLLSTEQVGDFLIERGADSFITNKPAAIQLCLRLGLESELVQTNPRYRRSLVLNNGKPVDVPRGFQLLMPTLLEPLMSSPLLTEAGKQRVAEEANVPPGHLEDESLASFVQRRFGQELFERLAQPMVGGIYTANPERLSLRATLPRFLEMEQQYGSLTAAAAATQQEASSGARYGLFASLRAGIGQLVGALAKRVEAAAEVYTSTPVLSVSQRESEWVLHTDADEQMSFDGVIIATPAWRAADLLRSSSPELCAGLREIEYASSAIVCSAYHLADIQHPMDAFGLVIPAIENRRILAVSFASRKFDGRAPTGTILLRTFVGGAMQPELLTNNDDQLLRLVQEELSDIFGVSGDPIVNLVTRYDRAMPQYHLGHVQHVLRIRDQLQGLEGLQIAGNAYDGVGIPDSVRSGEEAAEAISAT